MTLKNSVLSIPYFSAIKPVFILTGIFAIVACNQTKTGQIDDHQETRTAVISDSDIDTQGDVLLLEDPVLESAEFDQFEKLYLSTDQTYSIWPRVRAGFQLPDDVQHESLQNEIDWIVRHPEYIQRVMRRADPFLYYILEEAEKRDLPTELVLLPIVESAYQPFAYSHGRAAGIWQFIPSTGRYYGLKQNWWYDGRRDIYASTQAALNYLESLNKQFKGDWMLALAAYNSGSGTVQRAVKRNKKLNKPTDF